MKYLILQEAETFAEQNGFDVSIFISNFQRQFIFGEEAYQKIRGKLK